MAINVRACVIVGTQCGTLERNAGKQTPRTRVANNFGSHPGVGVCRSIATLGPSGNGCIGSELDLAAENRVHASVVHNQKNQVRCLSTDLEADAAALKCVHCWRSPWPAEVLTGAANHRT